jgi:competence protein ComFC
MAAKRRSVAKKFLVAVFPKRCALCGKVISPDMDSCHECNDNIPRVQAPVCGMCGRGKEECMCNNFRYYYSGIAAPFYYDGTVSRSIRSFKFRGKTQNAVFFSKEMADTVLDRFNGKKFDVIACVPLTKNSLRERGFNQSFLLAKEIGEYLHVYTDKRLLEKLYHTPAQHTMNSSMRRGNLAGVFSVVKPELVKNKTILLCDDVATTCSTVNECAKMLLLSGAKDVYCITAAVTRKAKNTEKTGG